MEASSRIYILCPHGYYYYFLAHLDPALTFPSKVRLEFELVDHMHYPSKHCGQLC